MEFEVIPYAAEWHDAWNGFVAESRNGTFLIDRRYMEYHADRFPDASILVRRPGGELVTIMPACRFGDTVYSHRGLTYGGFIVNNAMTLTTMVQVFGLVLDYYRAAGCSLMVYKPVPTVYHSRFTQEDLYTLHQVGGRIVRRDILSVAEVQSPLPFQKRRLRGVKKALESGVTLREAMRPEEWQAYWAMLEENLRDRHQSRPVHSVDEILLLRGRFGDNIRLHLAEAGGEMLAGIVVYATPRVARAQYIGSSMTGRNVGALDLLIQHLMQDSYADKGYIDLGSSVGIDGLELNVGLVEFKEGFGTRSVVQDVYEIPL